MSPGKEITDFEINNLVRRELVVRRLDTSVINFGTSGGIVYVNGQIKFIGPEVALNELPKYLYLLEQSLRGIRGVKNVKMEFEGWEKNKAGKWIPKREKKDDKKHKNDVNQSGVPSGGGAPKAVKSDFSEKKKTNFTLNQIAPVIYCPHCNADMVKPHKYCRLCGHKLYAVKNKARLWICEKCESIYLKEVKECQKCKGNLKEDSIDYFTLICDKCKLKYNVIFKYCPECGQDINKKVVRESVVSDPIDIREQLKDSQQEIKVPDEIVDDKEDNKDDLKSKVKMILEKQKEEAIKRKKNSLRDKKLDDVLKTLD